MARRHAEAPLLTAHHDCEFREVLDRVGDKWSLLVIAMLEQRPTARARFSELKRSIPGISQRMLTATLRVRAHAAGQAVHAAGPRACDLAPDALVDNQSRARTIRRTDAEPQGFVT